jgi:excisionase family DNA binding protein
MSDPADLNLWTTSRLARELGMSRSVVARMVKAGIIPPALVDGNRPLFNRATLEAYYRRRGEVAAEGRAS